MARGVRDLNRQTIIDWRARGIGNPTERLKFLREHMGPDWPDPARRGIDHINPAIYVKMQGPSELGISPTATLAEWSRFGDIGQIDVPALVIGATHDTMDPAHMEEVARRLPHGTYLHCPEGSHMAMYDDQETYFRGLIDWLDGLR